MSYSSPAAEEIWVEAEVVICASVGPVSGSIEPITEGELEE